MLLFKITNEEKKNQILYLIVINEGRTCVYFLKHLTQAVPSGRRYHPAGGTERIVSVLIGGN